MSEESELTGAVRTLTTPTREPIVGADEPQLPEARELATVPEASRFHLHEVIRDLSSVILVTSSSGLLASAHGRPMSIARVDTDGTLFFLGSDDSVQVKEIRRGDAGMCTGQTKTQYVSMEGRLEVVRDPATVAMLWSSAAEAWFPNGPADPRLCVIIFRPSAAEIWDMSGARGLSFLVDVAKAWMMGNEPPKMRDVHSKVSI